MRVNLNELKPGARFRLPSGEKVYTVIGPERDPNGNRAILVRVDGSARRTYLLHPNQQVTLVSEPIGAPPAFTERDPATPAGEGVPVTVGSLAADEAASSASAPAAKPAKLLDGLRRIAGYYRDLLAYLSEQSGRHLVDIGSVLRHGLVADFGAFIPHLETLVDRDGFLITLERTSPNSIAEILDRTLGDDDPPAPGGEGATEVAGRTVVPSGADEALAARRAASAQLQAIFRKQQQDPYNRETILGFPLVCGRYGSRAFCAPLFYHVVAVDLDPIRGTASVKKNFATPIFNSHLIAKLVHEEGEIDLVRQKVLTLLQEDEFSTSTIEQVIQALGELVAGLKGLTMDPRPTVPLADAVATRERYGAWVCRTSVVVNARRSNAFLQDDLAELAALSDVDGETVVGTILEDVPENVDEPEIGDPRSQDYRPLLFPLQYNREQQRAARLAEKARLLVIQGPPGTGKSQTIVNLICDLVSQGKSVLVTSHQNKALEVISDKLPDVDYLAMPLLKGDKEATAHLINKLESFNSVVSSHTLAGLERSVRELMDKIRDRDRQANGLAARFSELKILERSRFGDYHKYHSLRHLDQIDPRDYVPVGTDEQTARSLRRWLDLRQQLRFSVHELDRLLAFADDEGTPRKERAQRLQEVVDLARRALRSGDPQLFIRAREVLGDIAEAAEERKVIASFLPYLRTAGPQLTKAVARIREMLGVKPDLGELRRVAAPLNPPGARELATRAAEISAQVGRLLWKQPAAVPLADYPDLRTLAALRGPLEVLERCATSWLRWYISPAAWAARRLLRQFGATLAGYGAARAEVSACREWHAYWTLFREAAGGLEHLGRAGVPVPTIGERPDVVDLQRGAAVAEAIASIVVLLTDSPELLPDTLRRRLESVLDRLDDENEVTAAVRLLEFRLSHLDLLVRLEELRGDPVLGHLWESALRPCVEAVENLSAPDSAIAELERLRQLIPLAGEFIEMRSLEEGPLITLRHTLAMLADAVRDGKDPGWVAEAEKAVEAFRLSEFIRRDLVENPDDIGQVASAISRCRSDARDLTVRALRQMRLRGLKQAEIDNRTRQQIVQLRQILRRKRKTASLVQLRERIDYRQLLRVLPCWIMGIEDVARVFPLQAGLFDYLIVDEASQCNQATALHLAYRARRMIVVGDSKQLKNANARWLKDDLVRLLLAKHGLDAHPKAEFLHGREPLLQLAEACANRPVSLNEHFRCEPPIIAWSNREFYNGRLSILTPFRAKAFRPVLEVRPVYGAAEDPSAKRNEVEARAVIAEARRLIESGEAEGMDIGILSPFAAQATLLQHLLYEEFDDRNEWIKNYGLTVSTADGFQGDERDIMLYSFSFGPGSPPGRITALENEPERLNVAFTRARRKVICFVSLPVGQFPGRLIRGFLEHAELHQRQPGERLQSMPEDRLESLFERDVCAALRVRGLTVFTQVACASFRIDFVVRDDSGRRMAVECDGDFHYDEDGELRPEDHLRQDIIERNGWYVHRIAARQYYHNPEAAIARLLQDLARQPTDEHVRASEAFSISGPAGEDSEEDDVIEAELDDGAGDHVGDFASSRDGGSPVQNDFSDDRADGRDDREEAPVGFTTKGERDQCDSPGSEPSDVSLGAGPISRPDAWFQLSHWGKVTGKFTGYNNRFCYDLGKRLSRRLPFSDKQRRHALRIWDAAVSQGFQPRFEDDADA